MTTPDSETIILKPTPESKQVMEQLSSSLGTDIKGVISQAVNLLRMVQGRTVVLKSQNEVWEIKNFEDKPVQVEFNKK